MVWLYALNMLMTVITVRLHSKCFTSRFSTRPDSRSHIAKRLTLADLMEHIEDIGDE